jgi:hypothetical protein
MGSGQRKQHQQKYESQLAAGCITRVGQNRIYIYIYIFVYDCVLGDFSTQNTVYKLYTYGCSQPYVGRVGTLFFLRLSCQRVYKKG